MGEKKKKAAKEKPLEKMTAKELREAGLALGTITGVHGMNKAELISAIKQAKGIAEDESAAKSNTVMRDVKKKIRGLKEQRAQALAAEDNKKSVILRRRIARLKKITRRAA